MRITGLLAIGTTVALGLAVRADEPKPDGPKAIPVLFESMKTNNKLSGSVALGSIRVETEIGTLEIPASVLTDIEFAADTREDGKAFHHINTTAKGEEITGVIVAPARIVVTTR